MLQIRHGLILSLAGKRCLWLEVGWALVSDCHYGPRAGGNWIVSKPFIVSLMPVNFVSVPECSAQQRPTTEYAEVLSSFGACWFLFCLFVFSFKKFLVV